MTVMGDMGMIDDNLRAAIADAVDATRRNTKLRLNVALSYGARQDIVNACRLLATQAAAGLIDPEDITEDVLGEHCVEDARRVVNPTCSSARRGTAGVQLSPVGTGVHGTVLCGSHVAGLWRRGLSRGAGVVRGAAAEVREQGIAVWMGASLT